MERDFSVFEYLYRDAANYKTYGHILLHGKALPIHVGKLRDCLDSGEFFVAEQIFIPTLYEELHVLSGGSNGDDHAFHEFFNLRQGNIEDVASMTLWGELDFLLKAFLDAKSKWNCSLSPHCFL